MLAEYIGAESVQRLLAEHGDAIAALLHVKRQIEGSKGPPAPPLLQPLQSILLHAIRCEGFALLIERLPQERQQELTAYRERARAEARPLSMWRLLAQEPTGP